MLGVRADAPKLIEDGLRPAVVAPGEQDAVASGGEPRRHRATDPSRAAGHERRPPALVLVRFHLKPLSLPPSTHIDS